MKCFKKKKHTSIINIINIIAAGMTVRKIPAYAPRQPAWLSCPHALSGHLSLTPIAATKNRRLPWHT